MPNNPGEIAPLTDPLTEPLTISLDSITLDNVLNALEVAGTVTITGNTTSTSAGDTVTLTLNNGVTNSSFTGFVSTGGGFSVDVPGSVLAADNDWIIEASILSAGRTETINRTYVVDTDVPSVVSVTDDVPGIVNSSTGNVAYTYTFSEVVTDLDASDFTLTNGTITSVALSGTNSWRVDVSPTPGVAGTISLALAAGAVFDVAGNTNTASTSSDQIIDTRVIELPTISLNSITLDNVLNALEVAGTVTITGNTTNTSAGDLVTLTLNNGGISSTFSGSVSTEGGFSIDVPGSILAADSDRSITASVSSAGRIGTITGAYVVDTDAPRVVSVTDDVPGIVNSRTGNIAYTYTFSEVVTDLDASDFTLTNGTITSVAPSGTNSWRVNVSPAPDVASGTISLALRAGAVFDVAGNTNTASTSSDQSIDTLLPAAPAIISVVDNVGTITGIVTSGGRTDDTVLVLNGTAAAKSNVSIFNGDTQLGTVTAGSTGTWSYTTGTLTNGTTYAFNARATDAAGNQGASANYTVTVDTSAPAAPAIASVVDDVNPITGTVAHGGRTNDTILLLNGTAEANNIVSIFNGTTKLGTVTADSSGNWAYTTGTLTNRTTYTFNARATDVAGNQSTTSANYTITVDTSAPAAPAITSVVDDVGPITGTVASGGRTNDRILLLNGTAEANSTVSIFNFNEPVVPLGIVTAGSTGAWSYTTDTLNEGTTYAFNTRATDAAGNLSATSANYTVTVDTVAPVVAITSIGGVDSIVSGQPSDNIILGTAEANRTVIIMSGSTTLGTVTASSSGNFSYGLTSNNRSSIGQGFSKSITASQSDLAGNLGTSTPFSFSVDTVAPIAPRITSVVDDVGTITGTVASGGRTNDTILLLNGTAEANSTVSIFNGLIQLGTVTALSTGAWSYTTGTLPNGTTYAFNTKATDAAGNLSATSANYTVTVDTVAPAVTITSIGGGDSIVSGQSSDNIVVGTAEANRTVTIMSGSTTLGTVTATSSGNFSYGLTFTNLSSIGQGSDRAIAASQSDLAGNLGTSTPFSFSVDTIAPIAPTIITVFDDVGTITGTVASGGRTDDTSLDLKGKAEANSTVSIFNGTTNLGTATVDSDGNWAYTTDALTNGTVYAFNARSTDVVGNQSTSANYTVTVDTVAPVVTITSIGGFDSIVSGQSSDKTVVGRAEASRDVTIFNGTNRLGTVKATSTGAFSYGLTASNLSFIGQGPGKSITASQSDQAGNTGTSTAFPFSVDTVAPIAPRITSVVDDNGTIPVTVASGGRTDDTTLLLNGTAEANSTVSIFNGTTNLGTANVGSTGDWSYTTSPLTNGTNYAFNARATDAAGNQSTSPNYTVTVDTVAPVVTITSIGGGDSMVSGQSSDNIVLGTAEANGYVTLKSGNTILGIATATSSGNFSYSLTASNLRSIGQGSGKSIIASQSDQAGNLGTTSPFFFEVGQDAQPSNEISLKGNQTIFVSERANVAEVTVVRTGSGQDRVTLEYTTNEIGAEGAAQAGLDYTPPTLDSRPNTGQVIFEIGETQKTFQIPILNPSTPDPEGNETFAIGIQNPSTGTLGAPRTVLVTIVDDDSPSTIAMTAPAFTASEESPLVAITVQRSGDASEAATVEYTIKNGTAIANQDYGQPTTGFTGFLSFAPGQIIQTLMIPIVDDAVIENNENFSVELSNPQGAILESQTACTITLLDNDMGSGSLTRQTVVSGLIQPTALDWTPDGAYMLVAQKDGKVRVVQNGVLRSTPLVDLSNQVNNTRDRGMLGIAVHPDFSTNPYIYLSYTYDDPVETSGKTGLASPDGNGNRPSRLVRLTVDPATMIADPASLVVLAGTNSTWAYTSHPEKNSTGDLSILPSGIVNGLTITALPEQISKGTQDNSPNQAGIQDENILDYLATDSESHTVGAVHFGSDGKLYLANGDGTSYNFRDSRAVRVQDINNLSGKLLRIDPLTGEGVVDNPFFDPQKPNSNQSKVFYSGLRNPFRFTFDPLTNLPVVGDVGWNSWEEINTGVAGSNFGWPYLEGPNKTGSYQNLTQAITFYSNGNRNNTGDQAAVFPILSRSHGSPDLASAIVAGDFYNNNTLMFGDVNGGTLYAATLGSSSRQVTNVQVFDTDIKYVVDMEMGPDQRLYGVNLVSGSILRWEPV